MRKLYGVMLGVAAMATLAAQERFDFKVREDFFTGFAGNREALERGMKACEDALSKDPKHAEALVWHGGGAFFMSGQAFQKGDTVKGMELYTRGLKEMNEAVALKPDSVSVRIPRGASFLTASRNVPGDEGRKLLETGLGDYEKTYQLQQAYLDKLSGHARGELIFGLAEGYARLGNEAKAREYFQKLRAVGKESGHEAEAKAWLETGKIDPKRVGCVGCHVKG